MYVCNDCGRAFDSPEAAMRAVLMGCPGCAGTDVGPPRPPPDPSTAERLKENLAHIPAEEPDEPPW